MWRFPWRIYLHFSWIEVLGIIWNPLYKYDRILSWVNQHCIAEGVFNEKMINIDFLNNMQICRKITSSEFSRFSPRSSFRWIVVNNLTLTCTFQLRSGHPFFLYYVLGTDLRFKNIQLFFYCCFYFGIDNETSGTGLATLSQRQVSIQIHLYLTIIFYLYKTLQVIMQI